MKGRGEETYKLAPGIAQRCHDVNGQPNGHKQTKKCDGTVLQALKHDGSVSVTVLCCGLCVQNNTLESGGNTMPFGVAVG